MRRLASISVALVAAIAVAVVAAGSSRGAGGPYEVRAIFDNAAFAVPGEDVRIAGAPVGSIKSLDVCTAGQGNCTPASPPNKAAVTIAIDDARFTPFYANATCATGRKLLYAVAPSRLESVSFKCAAPMPP